MTKGLQNHTGVCAPILLDNVDTDQIIPSREMKTIGKDGLGKGLFAGWRYTYSGREKTGLNDQFVLNQKAYAHTSILLSTKNFGCGSSREHAVWALHDFGIRVVIAESFGQIFKTNCARNRVLAVVLKEDEIAVICAETEHDPQSALLKVDLENLLVTTPSGTQFSFTVDEFDRKMLLDGLDYIDFTLQFESAIDAFIVADKDRRPWAHL